MPFLPYAKRKLSFLFFVLLLASSPMFAFDGQPDHKEKETPQPHIDWQHGPVKADLGGVATIQVPKGYRFADAKGARQVLEMTQNPPSGDEVGVLLPEYSEDEKAPHWVMYFEFHDTGYISDEEKDKIDAGALLKNIQEGTEEGNKIRKEKGWEAFHITGWSRQPFFDDKTKNLTWGTLGHGDTDTTDSTVNYSMRILGRKGTVNVDLVIDPKSLETAMPTFNSLMSSFSYNAGSRYSEFIKGDKVASYGLTALIAGGAAAAAVKTGLFAKLLKVLSGLILALWKVIVVAFAALASRFRALLRWVKGLFGKKEPEHELAPGYEEQRALGSGDDSHDVH